MSTMLKASNLLNSGHLCPQCEGHQTSICELHLPFYGVILLKSKAYFSRFVLHMP